MRWIIGACAFAVGLVIYAFGGSAVLVYGVIVLFALSIIRGSNSVRWLLLMWLIAFVAMMIYAAWQGKNLNGAESIIWSTVALTVSTTIFWCISIGVTKHRVGKLAVNIVNTITSCSLVVTEVIVMYGVVMGTFDNTAIMWDVLQTVCLTGTMPFVIAGYLAALFKKIQIYAEDKYIDEKEE